MVDHLRPSFDFKTQRRCALSRVYDVSSKSAESQRIISLAINSDLIKSSEVV